MARDHRIRALTRHLEAMQLRASAVETSAARERQRVRVLAHTRAFLDAVQTGGPKPPPLSETATDQDRRDEELIAAENRALGIDTSGAKAELARRINLIRGRQEQAHALITDGRPQLPAEELNELPPVEPQLGELPVRRSPPALPPSVIVRRRWEDGM